MTNATQLNNNKLIRVGDTLPSFSLKASRTVNTTIDDAFELITDKDSVGSWKILVTYPADFTFVCPTELESFAEYNDKLQSANTVLYTLSTDTEFVHRAWRKADSRITNLPFAMLSDPTGNFLESIGALDINSGLATRVTLIVDPEGVVQYVQQNADNVGRNPTEVFRVLQALQTGLLCQAEWEPGDENIDLATQV